MIGQQAPTGWTETVLVDIADIERRAVLPDRIEPGTKYVGMEHLDGEGQILEMVTVANGELSSNKFIFGPEHILYGKLRPYLRKIARPDFRGICSTEIIPIRPGPRVDRGFLYYYLRHPRMVEHATARCEGANLPRLNPAELGQFPIFLPTLVEQQRIAAILDKTDGIRQKRREAYHHVADLNLSLFHQLIGDITRNERGWPVVSVADAGAVQLGRQRAPKYQSGDFTRPYLRVANVFEDRIDISDVLSMDFDAGDFERYRLKSGDILLNEGQSTELVGRPAMFRGEIADCCFQNTLIRFQPNRQRTEPEYALAVFLAYLRSGVFARVSSKTSSVAHLGAARFAAMPFPLPPLQLQQEFAFRRQAVRNLEREQVIAEAQTGDLFNSLVQRAFRGEL